VELVTCLPSRCVRRAAGVGQLRICLCVPAAYSLGELCCQRSRYVKIRLQTGYRVIVACDLGRFWRDDKHAIAKQIGFCVDQCVLGSLDSFRGLARSRVAVLAVRAAPRRGRSFVSGIQFYSGLCSLNSAPLLRPTSVALRYYRACTAALTRKRAVAQTPALSHSV